MRIRLCLTAIAFGMLWTFVAHAAGNAFLPVDETIAALETKLTDERRAALEKGELLRVDVSKAPEEGEQRANGTVMVLVERPAAEVFARIVDVSDQHEYMPRVERIEPYTVVDANPMGQRYTLKVAFREIVYHILVKRDPEKRFLTWHLDDDQKNGIAATTGYWYFQPWGEDRCLAVYSVSADTGMRVPKWLARWLMNRDMPGVVEALKKRAESDGVWTK